MQFEIRRLFKQKQETKKKNIFSMTKNICKKNTNAK